MASIISIQSSDEKLQGIHLEIDCNEPVLGEGNFGIVRKGVLVDEKSGLRRDVAIKFLYDDLGKNSIIRAQKEASIRIVHENLVEMIDFVETEDADSRGRIQKHYHVVSELLHGVMLYDLLKGITVDAEGNEVEAAKDLYDMLQNNRTLFALKITRSVLSGIMALHDHGYIHRDIDPSNIMVTSDGKIKLIDLGIAKSISPINDDGPHLTSTGDFVGKAAYAAPELVRGDISHQNATTDIYAIGIMLYQLVTGELPFVGSVQEMLDQQIKSKLPLDNIDDKNLRDIIEQATEKKQEKRFQSAAQFRVELDNFGKKPIQKKNGGSSSISSTIIIAIAAILGLAGGILLALV